MARVRQMADPQVWLLQCFHDFAVELHKQRRIAAAEMGRSAPISHFSIGSIETCSMIPGRGVHRRSAGRRRSSTTR